MGSWKELDREDLEKAVVILTLARDDLGYSYTQEDLIARAHKIAKDIKWNEIIEVLDKTYTSLDEIKDYLGIFSAYMQLNRIVYQVQKDRNQHYYSQSRKVVNLRRSSNV